MLIIKLIIKLIMLILLLSSFKHHINRLKMNILKYLFRLLMHQFQ